MSNPVVRLDYKKFIADASKLGANDRLIRIVQNLDLVDEFSGQRADANETAFVSRDLEYIMASTFDVEYPGLKARSLVPVSNEVDSGADKWTYRQYDMIAPLAAIVSDYRAADFPQGDVKIAEFSRSVIHMGSSYSYNWQELRACAFAKRRNPNAPQLDVMRAAVARLMIENRLEQVAAIGESVTGTTGLFNAPNITTVTANTKAATGTTWAVATPAEILADILKMRAKIMTDTKNIHSGNTLLLGTSNWSLINNTYLNSGTFFTSDTIHSFLRRSIPELDIQHWVQNDTAGTSNTELVCLYEKNPRVVQFMIPQEFEQTAPEVERMAYIISCHASTGGVQVRYPKAVTIMQATV